VFDELSPQKEDAIELEKQMSGFDAENFVAKTSSVTAQEEPEEDITVPQNAPPAEKIKVVQEQEPEESVREHVVPVEEKPNAFADFGNFGIQTDQKSAENLSNNFMNFNSDQNNDPVVENNFNNFGLKAPISTDKNTSEQSTNFMDFNSSQNN
jgi:hypothetical protein